MAAQARERIARRFRNEALSQSYYASLKLVKVVDIPLLSPDRKQTTDGRPDAARVERHEFGSDQCFVQDFLASFKVKESPTQVDTPIERMLKKVDERLLKKTDENLMVSGAIELYTNDTRTEFHELLLFLLHRFEHVLNLLVPKKHSSGNALQPSQFKEAVEQLAYYAFALLRLARGRAFRMHLENIGHLLKDPRHTSAGASTDDHIKEHNNARKEDQEEDFDGILPPQKLKSYVAWLRLIVAHFDAVEILTRFVEQDFPPYCSISIQVLVPPSTSSDKLDWRKLFEEGPLPSPALYEFLQKGVLAVKDRNDSEAKRRQTPEIAALRETLEQHPGAASFFRSLGRVGRFTGALHCEAYLASLLPAFTNSLPTSGDIKEKQILQHLQVKHIPCHLFGPHFLFLQ